MSNQDNPEPKEPKTPHPSQKTTWKRSNLVRFGIPALLALVVVTALAFVAFRVIEANASNVRTIELMNMCFMVDLH